MAGRPASLPQVEGFPHRLKRALWYRDMTQKDLALALGVSQNTLSNLMRGNTADPGMRLLYAIATQLNVSVDYLLGLSDEIERR